MDDLISRQGAVNEIIKYVKNKESNGDLTGFVGFTPKGIIEVLKRLPSAQPERRFDERKKGRWIYYPKASGLVKSTAVHLFPVCSECGREYPVTNFCPNCGAEMEVEERW